MWHRVNQLKFILFGFQFSQVLSFSGPTVDSSLVLLREAQAQLCRVLHDKFDQAVKDDDTASVERFFKIFPLLNMHEEGISKFGNYLAGQVIINNNSEGILVCLATLHG